MLLVYIGEGRTIYCGLCLLVAGIVSNGMNIFIFSTVHNYHEIAPTFYFIVASADNMICILFIWLLVLLLMCMVLFILVFQQYGAKYDNFWLLLWV